MAAALIPLIAGLAPEIINLIVGLVHPAATKAEDAGTLTGPVKFADVFVSVMGDLAKAKAAGTISEIPADPTVKTIIQAVVTSMQLSGVLGSGNPSPVTTPTSQSIVLKAGQSLLVTA